MKKLFLILTIAVLSTVAASAQPRAIGARFGYGAEISYQHDLGSNFVEADLCFPGFWGLGAAATYNFMIAQPKWTEKGTWGFYAGPGAVLNTSFQFAALYVGVCGQVGLEYIFENTPLQLSIDWRPTLGPAINKEGVSFGWAMYGGGLSIRYKF